MDKPESGPYTMLFSDWLKEIQEERLGDLEPGTGTIGLRLPFYRALVELDDQSEMD